MKPKFILALDQGTTSSRTVLFNEQGGIVGIAQQEFRQIFPQYGWVEHDAKEIIGTQLGTLYKVIKDNRVDLSSIAGIGITNQRETTVVWDRKTGEPIYNAIVWQDKRTASICESLRAKGLENYISETTGLVIDSYFSGTKIKWILDNVPHARERAERKELAFGTVDSWLIWNLTQGKVHATDYTNASRTMLFNIHELVWDGKMMEELNIPSSLLPEVKPSAHEFGFY